MPYVILKSTMANLVTLKVYTDIENATLAQEFLNENGIDAYLRVDETGGMNPSASTPSGILLLVDLKDLSAAQELLQIT